VTSGGSTFILVSIVRKWPYIGVGIRPPLTVSCEPRLPGVGNSAYWGDLGGDVAAMVLFQGIGDVEG